MRRGRLSPPSSEVVLTPHLAAQFGPQQGGSLLAAFSPPQPLMPPAALPPLPAMAAAPAAAAAQHIRPAAAAAAGAGASGIAAAGIPGGDSAALPAALGAVVPPRLPGGAAVRPASAAAARVARPPPARPASAPAAAPHTWRNAPRRCVWPSCGAPRQGHSQQCEHRCAAGHKHPCECTAGVCKSFRGEYIVPSWSLGGFAAK